jgi:hypothetical protein
MRVTVDTNVLISASFWDGASEKVIGKAESGEIKLVLSKEIIEEFSKVLDYEEIQKKIIDKNLEMKRTLEKIVSLAEIVEPKRKFNLITEDIDDNSILECAFEGKVDFIVSRDNHLLKIKEFEGIKIVSPEQFLSS